MASENLEQIDAELSRIEESATFSAQNQFEQAKLWKSAYLWLSVPAAALAALTGGSLLADVVSTELAGVLVLLSAALGGAVTALSAAERGKQCEAAGNDYIALQSAARVARDVDLPRQSFSEARVALSELIERRDKTHRTAPTPSKLAWRRGKKNVDEGGQSYEVDRKS